MNIETWVLFFATSFFATIVPGPSVLLGLNHGLIHGKRKSIATALGITSAALIMGFVSLIRLGAIIITSGLIFNFIKYLGAAYLIYLGIRIWRAPVCTDSRRLKNNWDASFFRLYAQAFLVGMSNPKAIIFFTALFPQFLSSKLPQVNQFIILLFTLGFVVFVCMMIYVIGGESLAPLLKKMKFRRLLNKITGGTFVGFGIGVALSE